MPELLLPSTDRAVLIQVLAVVLAGSVGYFLARGRSELRLVVIGGTILLLGLIGPRSLH